MITCHCRQRQQALTISHYALSPIWVPKYYVLVGKAYYSKRQDFFPKALKTVLFLV